MDIQAREVENNISEDIRSIIRNYSERYDPNDLRDALFSAVSAICSENCLLVGLRHKREVDCENRSLSGNL